MTISLETGKITIGYRDGRAIEGFVLARYGNTMSVAVRDADDAVLFTCVHGNWISEDCEPVEIRFDWHRQAPGEAISEADCICSKELAARLIQTLVSGDESECDGDANYEQARYAPLFQRVV
ncbi:MAG: hypothetical protein ACLQU1_20675 [Bryobacteraceae bacterium]